MRLGNVHRTPPPTPAHNTAGGPLPAAPNTYALSTQHVKQWQNSVAGGPHASAITTAPPDKTLASLTMGSSLGLVCLGIGNVNPLLFGTGLAGIAAATHKHFPPFWGMRAQHAFEARRAVHTAAQTNAIQAAHLQKAYEAYALVKHALKARKFIAAERHSIIAGTEFLAAAHYGHAEKMWFKLAQHLNEERKPMATRRMLFLGTYCSMWNGKPERVSLFGETVVELQENHYGPDELRYFFDRILSAYGYPPTMKTCLRGPITYAHVLLDMSDQFLGVREGA